MRAAYYEAFRGPIGIVELPDPTPEIDGVVVRVEATGLCRSDWHGWMGHDPDITLPHVPGHELAGTVVAVGAEVTRWRIGDRITVPFAAGCGSCRECTSGNEQVCDRQYQPGFMGWGSFAEYVALRYADHNLVSLPDGIPFSTGAILGCRLTTAFRAVVDQGRVRSHDEVVVFGCGGVGLSAVLVAKAHGAHVVAVEPSATAQGFAIAIGADLAVDGADDRAIVDATAGGPDLSIDAVGHPEVLSTAVRTLRPGGRHVQVGLVPEDLTCVPMSRLIGKELEILGSHGMSVGRYADVIDMIDRGVFDPERIIHRRIPLSEAPEALENMAAKPDAGVTVVDRLDA